MTDLSCFKAYDIRGEIGVNIDEGVAYRVGRAVAQHLGATSVVIGFDARETSPAFAAAASQGVRDAGSDVITIGMAGTEEMYWAVTEFGACAGIEVTASHNPIHYNGMKIVKSQSQPLEDLGDFQAIKALASSQAWSDVTDVGREFERSEVARQAYVGRVLSFVDLPALRPLKIVVNSGNGAAGPTFDAIAEQLLALSAPLEFVRVHHTPDATFPNGIPNPLLPENHAVTADVVKAEKADFGVAFDGDFDRCFFFDEAGQFVPGEYVVGLLASIFLEKEVGAKIVHDPRVIWNTQGRREFLHVDDMAAASLFVLNLQKATYDENTDPMLSHINVGTGVDISILELAQLVAKVIGFKGKISTDPTKPDGTMRKLMDVGRLSQMGWSASIELEQGLADKANTAGVVTSGPSTAIDCKNTLLQATNEDQQLVAMGLEDIIVVAMTDAVLVAHKDRAQDVKIAVTKLKAKGVAQAEVLPRDYRPWGWYESIALGSRFQVKRIVVNPGASLSLQSHHHRSEHWIVVEGTAKVTIDAHVKIVTENQSVYIPLGAVHRMENPGKLPGTCLEQYCNI